MATSCLCAAEARRSKSLAVCADSPCSRLTPSRKRLRVHSALMSRASSVFKALLLPRFREGTELNATGAVEVACPEDDGEAMTTICYIIHHQASKIQESTDLSDLVKGAQLSDKYDLNGVMKTHAHYWLSGKMERSDTGDHVGFKVRDTNDRTREWILAAAYVFNMGALFEKAGREILLKNTTPASNRNTQIGETVPNTVMDVLGKNCRNDVQCGMSS